MDLSASLNEKNCPYCDEKISLNAKKCKHCGEILDQQMRDIEQLKRDRAQNPNIVVSNNNNNNNNNGNGYHPGYVAPKSFPHLLHFVLTFFTAGLWLVVWVFHYIFRDKEKYR
ncbi:zinc ribbon domain-containing protein [Leclercia adecarboxylata]|uniref:zinc ribbon domain-containing protein n=1 Tax=Leclercia TaxID=83654 RepID=UPI0012BB2386|nr:zinc ribbon domain-containing protein [Leclercia adecarboxylata]QGP82910.1 hypothetical protein GLX29_06305 [Leclercia adecarboxylata]HDC4302437.1 hypothetical protein [Enterobacter kobei]